MDAAPEITLSILLIGVAIVIATGLGAALERMVLPPLIGFIALGLGISYLDQWVGIPESGLLVVEFLARAGIIALLFKIGLESKLQTLLSQLRGASLVWASDIVLSAGLGFGVANWLLGFELIPSIIAATALSATSVGIPTRLWQSDDLLESDEGARFLDVAELDDVSAVVLMAILFAVLPEIREGTAEVGPVLGLLGWFTVKLALFGAGCAAFSLYLEKRLTHWLQRVGAPSAPPIIGISFIIAAIGALLGFSEAIGAFFAGLAFSRDPDRVKLDASIDPLHDLLSPFFFIGIGAAIPLDSLSGGLLPGLALAGAAIVGKVIGAGVPNISAFGWSGALLIGVSMVPRAEISMVVIQRGSELGSWATPESLFSAIVLVSLLTSTIAPMVMRRWLLPRVHA